jgi:hypothetical protein
MILDDLTDDHAASAPWWSIETITIATARLGSLNARLAEICLDDHSDVDGAAPASTVRYFSAARVFSEHGERWSEVVPESVRLDNHRAKRPMPALFDSLSGQDWVGFRLVIAALFEATNRLASGLQNPEGQPFWRVCQVVLADLDALGDTASASRTGTFDDTLSVFTLD